LTGSLAIKLGLVTDPTLVLDGDFLPSTFKRGTDMRARRRATTLIDIQPLVTVWLQVQVLPGPPVNQ